ncbi:hypothetical protein RJ640_002699 [Escallonia rubra]|uniref:Uncharacterized protein n=1 Tax=Escallonia rubra TaxID=112253 RepID=A0AA88RAP1_9ASTE|nr:hypothetical protein RJ640_002699 [Escallonia rubra]
MLNPNLLMSGPNLNQLQHPLKPIVEGQNKPTSPHNNPSSPKTFGISAANSSSSTAIIRLPTCDGHSSRVLRSLPSSFAMVYRPLRLLLRLLQLLHYILVSMHHLWINCGDPCVVSGALYALITMVTGCGCMYSCFYRSKMRSLYMLPENPCGDCLVYCCCEACALCQEYRELKHGSVRWQENVDRQNRGVAMASVAPPVQGGMNRY